MSEPTRIYKPGGTPAKQHQDDEERHPDEATAGHKPEPKPFPTHRLPAAARAIARAIAESTGTPEALTGPCALAALSCSIGAGLEIQSGPNQTTRGNLYVMLSGVSGSGKSKACEHTFDPLFDFDHEQRERWKTKVLPTLETDKEMLEDDIKRLRADRQKAKDDKKRHELRDKIEEKMGALKELQARMREPRLYTQDVTSQSLGKLMAEQPGECLSSISADARELADIWLGKYTAGKGTDENFYVQSWTGDPYESDRVTRGNVSLKRPCLSGCWLLQPDKQTALFAEQSLMEGGHLARILICHTNCKPQKIGAGRNPIPPTVQTEWRKTVRRLLETYRLAKEPWIIELTEEAMQAMNAHHDAIVDRWDSGEVRDVGSFALRWTEQALRIAACLHAGTWLDEAHEHTLDLETAQAAIELADWFAEQQLEILKAGRSARKLTRAQEVQTLLLNHGGTMTLRDLERRHGITHEDAQNMAADFPDLLTYKKKTTGGRPTETLSAIKTRK